MDMKYKYIYFDEEFMSSKRKTRVFLCKNNDSHDTLGTVKWYSPWRCYCYFPSEDLNETIYSEGCLDDIRHFIHRLMVLRKVHNE